MQLKQARQKYKQYRDSKLKLFKERRYRQYKDSKLKLYKDRKYQLSLLRHSRQYRVNSLLLHSKGNSKQ